MRKYFFILALCAFISCTNRTKAPDVSHISVSLETLRFENDFFSLDTSDLIGSLSKLEQKYPGFSVDFIYNILGLDIAALQKGQAEELQALKQFLTDYKPIKDTADKLYNDFSGYSADIKKGLQYVKYYFPEYELPNKIITFVGPLNANFQTSFGLQGDVLTEDGLGIALQLHLGKDFSFYTSPAGQALYPAFISANFDGDHITVNSMRNIADDLFEEKSAGKALVEQMVGKGKFLYLISRFLPETPDHILIGYTEEQMKAAKENEGVVWSFFLNNELLNTQEQDVIKNYIGESPKTSEFGDDSPGNLGSFAGWQIVKKFMDKFPDTTLTELMETDAREIYNRSKYKPKG